MNANLKAKNRAETTLARKGDGNTTISADRPGSRTRFAKLQIFGAYFLTWMSWDPGLGLCVCQSGSSALSFLSGSRVAKALNMSDCNTSTTSVCTITT